NTVERATRAAATTGAAFLTVHALDTKTLRAAVTGAAGTGRRILGVPVLTSLDGGDLAEQGIAEAPGDVVVRRARLASDAGCAGIVASGGEAAPVRRALGPDATIVTPGIRAPGGAAGDQTRLATPHAGGVAGAGSLVVGRPISQAADRAKAAAGFVRAIEEALAARQVS